MSDLLITVGEAIARTLEQYQVSAIYGVISIHNLPIADAIGQREQIRFVPARGEAGAASMADAHSRFHRLGVVLTSTGAGAGNAAGALMEAYNAGSPLLHLTGQVESAYLEAENGFIHETKDQLALLQACGKAALRVRKPEQAVAMLHHAIQLAQTAPYGPVSLEIPIDIQTAKVPLSVLSPVVNSRRVCELPNATIEALATRIAQARKPILWLGGGALGCQQAATQLADLGLAVISSTHGRGIVADSHPRSLRAFHNSPAVETLLAESDLLLIAGSRLRSNETRSWSLPLPQQRIQIDIDATAANRNYPVQQFIQGDCQQVLTALASRLAPQINPDWDKALAQAVHDADSQLRKQSGIYAQLSDALGQALPADGILVRDVTVSASVWGSRLFRAPQPLCNIHSLAGAIGMGLPMAIGSAIANPQRKVVALVGDGGLALGLGELATLAQEQLNLTLLVMNDGGYGVMRGIQDKYFAGRQYFNQLHTPDFCLLAKALGLPAIRIQQSGQFNGAMQEAISHQGPLLVEVDMQQLGSIHFAGPPQKSLY
ncbi:thiamine pyrophosphate-binding protein [Neisseriaceae bacterium TC5R-5]|nr:thiamine pyrophosphate-binding protein [Neisseriaceae bacterium TC5R-5]